MQYLLCYTRLYCCIINSLDPGPSMFIKIMCVKSGLNEAGDLPWELQESTLLLIPVVTRVCSCSIVAYCSLWYGVLMSSLTFSGKDFSLWF